MATTSQHVHFASHEAINRPELLANYSIIVNFTRHPETDARHIDVNELPEVRLAKRLAPLGCHLIQLSSQRVYAPPIKASLLSERSTLNPTTVGGINKVAGERAISDILRERLTILRLGNVFGLELQYGRRTFMARLLASLRTDRRIIFDMSPSTRRDFLPDKCFARIIDRVVARPISGIYNLGSGIATRIGDIAEWTIAGFGPASIICTSEEEHDSFALDIASLTSSYGPVCTHESYR